MASVHLLPPQHLQSGVQWSGAGALQHHLASVWPAAGKRRSFNVQHPHTAFKLRILLCFHSPLGGAGSGREARARPQAVRASTNQRGRRGDGLTVLSGRGLRRVDSQFDTELTCKLCGFVSVQSHTLWCLKTAVTQPEYTPRALDYYLTLRYRHFVRKLATVNCYIVYGCFREKSQNKNFIVSF